MKKAKYHYNKQSLQFEKVEETLTTRLLRILGFISVAIVFALIIVVFAFKYLDSPKEKQLKRELTQMVDKFDQLNHKMAFYDGVVSGLQERDENIYRTIFEADPISENVREAGFGGSDRFKYLENLSNSELLVETSGKMEHIGKQLYVQSKSYDELIHLLKDKEDMFASMPAIQPVANKDLKRMASGFGMRVHPIYKTRKMHTGCDFSAPTGTHIHATGKGEVVEVKELRRGYGHYVVINHGYNFKTLYAHMDEIYVKVGEKVARGQVIGTVGNTGTSTAPHLHYEVIKVGTKVDPINYFYNDLSPEEFDQMIEISSRHNQSFD